MKTCSVCRNPMQSLSNLDGHVDCLYDFNAWLHEEFVPLVHSMGKREPLLTLYCISPEYREIFNESLIRE